MSLSSFFFLIFISSELLRRILNAGHGLYIQQETGSDEKLSASGRPMNNSLLDAIPPGWRIWRSRGTSGRRAPKAGRAAMPDRNARTLAEARPESKNTDNILGCHIY
jgi:hypothetical protein